MKDFIREPVKVDARGRVITGDAPVFRWRLNVPASVSGTKKQRLFFRTQKAARAKREALLAFREGLSDQQLAALAARGMTVEDAVKYALAHAPVISTRTLGQVIDAYVHNRISEVGVGERYLATLTSYRHSDQSRVPVPLRSDKGLKPHSRVIRFALELCWQPAPAL